MPKPQCWRPLKSNEGSTPGAMLGMKTLHLNLTEKWFDMILSGEKKEDYRDITDYYQVRFKNVKSKGIKTITFSNGYSKNRRQMVVIISYISLRQGLVEWGAEKGKTYLVAHLGTILSTKNLQPAAT